MRRFVLIFAVFTAVAFGQIRGRHRKIFSSGGGGTPSVDAGCKNQAATAGTSFTATCGSMGAITSGDLIAMMLANRNGCSATTNQADDNSNTGNYTSGSTRFADNDNCQQAQWFLFYNSVSVSAGSFTMTGCTGTLSGATCSGGTSETTWGIAGVAITNAATSSGVDATANGTAQASGVTTLTAPSVTTTHAKDIIISSLCVVNDAALDNLGTVTVSAPYAFVTGAGSGSNGCWLAEQVVTSTGTYTGAAFSWSFANTPTVTTIALKGS